MKTKIIIPVLISFIMIFILSCKNDVVNPTIPIRYKNINITVANIPINSNFDHFMSYNGETFDTSYVEELDWKLYKILYFETAGTALNDNVLNYLATETWTGCPGDWALSECHIFFNHKQNIIDSLSIIFTNYQVNSNAQERSGCLSSEGINLVNIPFSYNTNNEIEANITGNNLIGKISNIVYSSSAKDTSNSSNLDYDFITRNFKSIKSISDSSFVKLKIIPAN